MKTAIVINLLVATMAACAQSTGKMAENNIIEKVYNSKDELKPSVQMPEEVWREKLTPEQYDILRNAGTERPFTGKYWNTTEVGIYYSVASGEPLFKSDSKFDAGCGWPSFFEPIDPAAITYVRDNKYGWNRIEILDTKTGSHLGHVFDDGPPPTGLRYCLNSAALIFVPLGEDPQDYGVGED